jgi:hypothetical protein
MRTSRLFGPDFDETKFRLQLGIVHNLVPQRFATARYDLDDRLHSRLDSAGNHWLCNVCLAVAVALWATQRACLLSASQSEATTATSDT